MSAQAVGGMQRAEVIVAGQGVFGLGKCIAHFSRLNGMQVAYKPPQGPEAKVGDVERFVVVSPEETDSAMTGNPDYLIAMSLPSMEYLPLLKEGGTLLVNCSLVPARVERQDIDVVRVPATEIAEELKGEAEGLQDVGGLADSVMFGVYLALTMQEPDDRLLGEVYTHSLAGTRAGLMGLNIKAVQRGYEFARSSEPMVEYGR